MANSTPSPKISSTSPEGKKDSSPRQVVPASLATKHDAPPKTVLLLSASVIDPGTTPNRVPSFLNDEEFEKLAASILLSHGNQEPIQVRPLVTADGAYEFALISGARRLHACKRYGLPVSAIVTDISAEQALVQRLIENNLREPLCAWELGVQVAHIRSTSAYAPSVRELAQLIGIDKAMVQKALDIAALPQEVIEAFSQPRDIRYNDAKALKDLVAQSREEVIQAAEALKGAGLPAKQVIERLTQAVQAPKEPQATPSVEPFNMPQKMTMQVGSQAVGEMVPGKLGELHITLNAYITHAQQLALAEHLERFIARKILQIKVDKSVDDAADVVQKKQNAANDKNVKTATSAGFGNEEVQA